MQTDTFTPTGILQFPIHLACLCLGCRRKSENSKETLQTHGERANSNQPLLHFHCLTTCFGSKFVVKTQNQIQRRSWSTDMKHLLFSHSRPTECCHTLSVLRIKCKKIQHRHWLLALCRVSYTLGWECDPVHMSRQTLSQRTWRLTISNDGPSNLAPAPER